MPFSYLSIDWMIDILPFNESVYTINPFIYTYYVYFNCMLIHYFIAVLHTVYYSVCGYGLGHV